MIVAPQALFYSELFGCLESKPAGVDPLLMDKESYFDPADPIADAIVNMNEPKKDGRDERLIRRP